MYKQKKLGAKKKSEKRLASRGCIGCYSCFSDGKCVFDDIVNETAKKFEKADGIIVGSPVYFSNANATLLALLKD